jgi:hypothetical protein
MHGQGDWWWPMGGSIMKCIDRFHDIGKGLEGCNNDKSKVILGWNILLE